MIAKPSEILLEKNLKHENLQKKAEKNDFCEEKNI